MKLRNKKTGGLANILNDDQDFIRVYTDAGWHDYDSLAELNAEWEDYKPAEPLIKDEKIRKVVRAWAEANSILGDEKVEVSTPTIDCCVLGLLHGFTSIDLIIDGEVTLKNHGRYTIVELCGEGEE